MFEEKAQVRPSYCSSTVLYNWKSTHTGIEVVLVKCKTPAVNGYFAVATEIDNDSGYPHTLEHLVFMGSKKYPFKGYLDILGNKLLSSTNAWTGKDQTVYTLSTAGWQGFEKMLPVYLDHILYPKITKATCKTEVFHIDGAGQERGVVFSEMQGVENTPFSLIASELHHKMYGEGHPYAINTGGLLKALRVITHDQIKQYHQQVYSPRNLSVIVTGQVEPEELLAVMNEFDAQFDEEPPKMRRPFSDIDPAPPLTRTVIETLEFPETSETFGEAQMGWFGTSVEDLIGYEAIEVLNYYFTAENNGKLQRELVEVEDPLCNGISVDTDDYKITLISISLSCVPTERLDQVDAAVMKILKKATRPENIDLEFMRDSVLRKRDKFFLNVENDPAAFAYMAIDSFLYGSQDAAMLKQWCVESSVFDQLIEWSAEQWAEFIKRYFVDPHHTTILGKPSRNLETQVKVAKKERLAQIKREYDLKTLEKELEQVKEEIDTPIPLELVDDHPLPDLSRIPFIRTETARVNGEKTDTKLQELIDQDVGRCGSDGPPLFDFQFESYESQFITIKIYLSSHTLDQNLLPYVDVLFCELLALPMKLDDGTELTAEQVGLEVNRDMLVTSFSTNAMLQELVMIDLRLRRENYPKAIMWVERAIFNVLFDQERCEMYIKKYLASVSEETREGNSVMIAAIHEHSLTRRSLRRESEMLLVEEFFRNAKDDIPRVVKDMQRLIDQLFLPNNFRILVFGDIYKLKCPVSSWKGLYERLKSQKAKIDYKETVGKGHKGLKNTCNSHFPQDSLTPVPFSSDYRSELGKNPKLQSIITLCPTDSSYMSIVAKAPTHYLHPDTPALTLLNVYLGVTEGPLWREIRGDGLAYGARIFHRQELGYVICEFYSASDPINAHRTTRKLLNEYADGTRTFTPRYIEGAIAGFTSALALDQSTSSSAVIQKYFDTHLKNLGEDHIQRLIAAVSKVTVDELVSALKNYLLPLFEPESSAVFTVCHGSESEPIKNYFSDLGYQVSVKTIAVDSDEESEESESEKDGESESMSD